MDLDAQALAALNFGADPNVGALILEEFFGGDDDRSRDRSQILADHLVPGVGGSSRRRRGGFPPPTSGPSLF